MNNLEVMGEEPAPEVAMGIKRCLENMVKEARRSQLEDLAEFLALAILAADDAARAARKTAPRLTGHPTAINDLAHSKVAGTC